VGTFPPGKAWCGRNEWLVTRTDVRADSFAKECVRPTIRSNDGRVVYETAILEYIS
jgi:hypothetical protein